MKYSALFGKTKREAPQAEVSTNARLLSQAGFIEKTASGMYNYLPLGWRVYKKIEQIVREEMNEIGGQELNLIALHPKSVWEKTGRWASFDVLYKTKGKSGDEFALGSTHEEIITPIVAQFVFSYRDLPLYLYQIQVKFRDEPRAKSGLLRGREFIMKDLYSFHVTEDDRVKYYERVGKAYEKIFRRCELSAVYTEASGGAFSHRSHEFQVITDAGEDEIFFCLRCNTGINREIAQQDERRCAQCGGERKQARSIEVGNIFPLGTRFSEVCGAYFTDRDGSKKPIIMGSYGIGLSRLMGAVVEVFHDEKGIMWPKSISPYVCQLIVLPGQSNEVRERGDHVYGELTNAGFEILYDERDVSAGEKFADADLIGIPVRLVISAGTKDKIEWRGRTGNRTDMLSVQEVQKRLLTT